MSDPDDELTADIPALRQPMSALVRRARRAMVVMAVVSFVSLCLSAFLLLWQLVYLQDWRQTNRSILSDVQARVRAIDERTRRR